MSQSNNHGTPPEIVEPRPAYRAVRYQGSSTIQMPPQPQVEIGGGGFLGLGADPLDLAHARRMKELYQIGRELHYAEQMATALEIAGVSLSGQGMQQVEEIVYDLPANGVAGMLAADMASEVAARLRLRHARYMDAYDAESLNIVHRR